ncbi:11332_t:CDS:2 [Acaulospora morrowiae]|uniref:11332_t:CDS:1 n=1 Tax=Acaulospora morrowiae TaxID=94023 RepID=A0A9N8ZJ92_9GLOM|nr:11332_t:CDS:2 [Acaulospora morrowiae]
MAFTQVTFSKNIDVMQSASVNSKPHRKNKKTLPYQSSAAISWLSTLDPSRSLLPYTLRNIIHSGWLISYLSVFLFAIAILVFGWDKYVKKEPQGSVIFDFVYVLWITLVNQKNLENAKPSNMTEEQLKRRKVTWDDEFVEQSRIGLRAIKAFLVFPFYWVCYAQIYNNLTSDRQKMKLPKLAVATVPNYINLM